MKLYNINENNNNVSKPDNMKMDSQSMAKSEIIIMHSQAMTN